MGFLCSDATARGDSPAKSRDGWLLLASRRLRRLVSFGCPAQSGLTLPAGCQQQASLPPEIIGSEFPRSFSAGEVRFAPAAGPLKPLARVC